MNFFERIYLFFYLKRKQNSLKKRRKLPFPVISIGNINLGGTGKTPFTIALAEEAIKREYEPIILTRGYKGKIKGPAFVTKEYSVEEMGDEPLMMAQRGLKVVKSIDRYEGGLFAIEKLNLTPNRRAVFIMDDGFQHWQLHRDLDIVLIDGMRKKPFGNNHLFPFGQLRSPVSELFDADIIFITKKRNEHVYKELTETGLKKVYFAPFKIKVIMSIRGKIVEPNGHNIFAFAGIGSFESFIDLLKELKLTIGGYKKFIDHKKYTDRTVKKIYKLSKDFDLIVTTEKDFIKIKDKCILFRDKLCFLDISIEIEEQAVNEIFRKL